MTKKEKEARAAQAVAYLKEYLHAGDRVYTILLNVSRSGMSRHIDVVLPIKHKDGTLGIYRISHLVADALDYRRAKDGALVVGGCGMDMGFHVVYSLGSVLWGHGKESEAAKQGFITGRNGDTGPETDGGYLLKHSWV